MKQTDTDNVDFIELQPSPDGGRSVVFFKKVIRNKNWGVRTWTGSAIVDDLTLSLRLSQLSSGTSIRIVTELDTDKRGTTLRLESFEVINNDENEDCPRVNARTATGELTF